jgi:uncharacterized membrane protein YhhN
MVFLVGVAIALDDVDPDARRWFVIALVLSLIGDVLLMFDRFVLGLFAFLLGHIGYVAGFVARDVDVLPLAVGVAIAVLAGAVVGGRIVTAARTGSEPDLARPVSAYVLVISVMVATAVGTTVPTAIAGASLFYVSDALIAWNRFVRKLRWAPVAIMVTYHGAQALLVTSLAA